jgi:murein DD-endopeptidase MepM/ murein hydrolase activator NlpD
LALTDTRFAGRRARTLGAVALSVVVLGAAGAASASTDTGGIGTGEPDPATTNTTSTTGTTGSDGVFPVRGKHTYGDGIGAGRGHQGQDILARCGKRVVAAQRGRVAYRDYQGAAGNYVVIDGAGRRADEVYMHLQRRASVRKGERVEAGDPLGRVGDTGDATACHLHFEMWSEPGWYKGGRVIDPRPSLKRWDRAS